jgi:hypothetical protein
MASLSSSSDMQENLLKFSARFGSPFFSWRLLVDAIHLPIAKELIAFCSQIAFSLQWQILLFAAFY